MKYFTILKMDVLTYHFKMSELEKNIINLLPTLSIQAKNEARLILGLNLKKPKRKKEVLPMDEAMVLVRKAFKI